VGADKKQEAAGEAARIEASDWENSGIPQDLAILALHSFARGERCAMGLDTHRG